jgi:short-subunit dehydrogenase
MRAQGQGRIINVSSLGGRIAFPFHTSYCASKFAVEGLSECLRYEVSRFGIHVSVLAPGSFYTAIAEKSACSINAKNEQVYTELLRRVIEINKTECRKSTDFTPFARRLVAMPKHEVRVARLRPECYSRCAASPIP